jgi:integrase
VTLTSDEANRLMSALPHPYNLMVLTAAGLGLRVSEVVALKWTDFDFRKKTVTISRAYTHSALKETKSLASAATLPVSQNLLKALRVHKTHCDSDWAFPSPRTGRPYSADTILSKIIKPVAEKLKLPKVGWHTLRHSYRSWLGTTDAKLAQMKDLMRHSGAAMAMNYGRTPVDEMRPLNQAVASRLNLSKWGSKRPRASTR